MYRLLFGLLLVGMLREGCAQNLYHSLRNYTAVDGLPQSQVTSLVEDDNGYLWIGTQGGGIARFDGRSFKVYSTLDGLLGNFVNAMAIDKRHNLWILHHNGLTRYDGITFKKFQATQRSDMTKYLRRIFIAEDTVFTLSAEGHWGKIYNDSVYYWDKPLVEKGDIYACHQAQSGEFLFYLGNNKFMTLKDGEKRFFQSEYNPGQYFYLFNHDQEMWGRSETGMFRIDLQKGKLYKLPFNTKHFVMSYDKKGRNVFWTSDKMNLYRETLKDNQLEQDTILKDVMVGRVLPDSEDNVWFATDGRGLFKYYFRDFDKCGSENLQGVMAIQVDHEGASWIGTMGRGLWKIKNGKITSYSKKAPHSIHTIMKAPDNTIWVGTSMGLGRYNRSRDNFEWLTVKDGLSGNNVLNLDFDEKGGMWLGTSKGINYYDGITFKDYGVSDVASNSIWTSVYSKYHKALFFGGDYGVGSIKNDVIHGIKLPELENTVVLNIKTYQDSLLVIGTGGAGVVMYNPANSRKRFITTRDGLTSDFIYFVAPDLDGRIWIGMEKGISRIKLNEKLDIVENLHFDYDNGLTGVETNQNASFIDKDHKYFGLIDGLYEFNDLDKNLIKSFSLHLTDVEILYGEYSAHDYADSLMGFFRIPYNPILPSDKNHITFHFNRVDKRYPKSAKFKYFLQNFDKTWSLPSSMAQVTYSNLPPGDYCFRVMATNNEGSWSEDRIAYTFTIRAPFYQTASFIAGIIIFVAGSITLLMYLRVRQRVKKMIDTERIRMQELENLRKEIARDFHDEMGNQLTRIINYVSLLKLNANSNGNGANGHFYHQTDLYSKVEESAKFLYTGTRDFIWSIDPVNDELSKLFIHIRDFGEKLFEEKNIQFRAYDQVREKVKLPNGFSREANLIFKEVMTNAFKYSEAKNVTFSLNRLDDGQYQMTFDDDGVGFNGEPSEKSNGLKNIRERAERIGGVLRIESKCGQGTSIILEFKLNKTLKYGTPL